jgi:hypothetical protein
MPEFEGGAVTETETRRVIRDIADQLALRRLVEDYAAAVDTVDHTGWASLFLPDGHFEVRQAGAEATLVSARGRDELLRVLDFLQPYVFTQHYVCNHRVNLDGDEASGEVYCMANHVMSLSEGPVNELHHIRYLDEYVRTERGWRFRSRHLLTRWLQRASLWTAAQALPEDLTMPSRPSEPGWPR